VKFANSLLLKSHRIDFLLFLASVEIPDGNDKGKRAAVELLIEGSLHGLREITQVSS
jgi:hypothetical protein